MAGRQWLKTRVGGGEAIQAKYNLGETMKYKKSSPEQNVADCTTEAVSVQCEVISLQFLSFLQHATIDFWFVTVPAILSVPPGCS